MSNRNLQLKRALATTDGYRQFVSHVFTINKEFDPTFSAEKFCRLSGLKAKSTLSDIVSGRRRITSHLLPKVIKGLKLEAEVAEGFRLMVYMEEPDVNPTSDLDVASQLDKLRRNLTAEPELADMHQLTSIYNKRHWPRVFTALGDETGASIKDISRRTRLPRIMVLEALSHMQEMGIVTFDNTTEKFQAASQLLSLPNLGEEEQFRLFYLGALQKAKEQAEKDFQDQQATFLSATLSMNKADQPRLRKMLHAALTKVVQDFEDPHGDSVLELTVSGLL